MIDGTAPALVGYTQSAAQAQRQGHAGGGVLGQRGPARAAGGQAREPGDGARGHGRGALPLLAALGGHRDAGGVRRAGGDDRPRGQRRPAESRSRPGRRGAAGADRRAVLAAGGAAGDHRLPDGDGERGAGRGAGAGLRRASTPASRSRRARARPTSTRCPSPPRWPRASTAWPAWRWRTWPGTTRCWTPGAGMAVDFTVDNTPPKITGLQVSGTRFSAQAGFKDLVATFQVSKALAEPGGIEVLVGARAASCEAPSGGGYRCTYAVAGTEPEGPTLIKVTATDAAGNAGFESASVIFDFTAPALLSSERLARAGQARRRDLLLRGGERGAGGGADPDRLRPRDPRARLRGGDEVHLPAPGGGRRRRRDLRGGDRHDGHRRQPRRGAGGAAARPRRLGPGDLGGEHRSRALQRPARLQPGDAAASRSARRCRRSRCRPPSTARR